MPFWSKKKNNKKDEEVIVCDEIDLYQDTIQYIKSTCEIIYRSIKDDWNIKPQHMYYVENGIYE